MTDNTRHLLNFGGECIAFSIQRTTRRKTVAISVGFDGVRVLSPAELELGKIFEIIYAKGAWLLRKRAAYLELGGEPTEKEFVSGETFHYLGRPYRLKLVPDPEAVVSRVRARGASLIVPVQPAQIDAIRRAAVRSGLKQWYRRHASEKFPDRVQIVSALLGIETPPVSVVDQSKRWGSCDANGHIRLNWRLIMAPTQLVDYVIAHETCHVLEHNHSRRFWRALEVVMPDYEYRLRRLDRMGHTFFW